MELKNKIINIYQQEYKSVKARKIANLLKMVLVDKETDIDKIVKEAPITVNTMQKYIEEKKDILKFITLEEFELFEKQIEYIVGLTKQKNKELELDLLEGIISDIFHTRHRLGDICSNNYFNKNRFDDIFTNSNLIDEFFGVGTQQRINEKIKINDFIRKSCPRNMVLIEDRWSVFVAKEDVFNLNEIDHKKLMYASNYLCSGSNIEFVAKKFNVDVISILGFLSDLKLEQILKPEWNEKLKYYVSIEKLLLENKLTEKREFLFNFVEVLQQNNFDKKLAMTYFKLPVALFDRVLKEILKMPFFNEETKKDIIEILNIENQEIKVK